MQTLDYREQIIFSLRQLYNRYGYRPYKMHKFEEYDLYARNKDFLISDSVITFTDLGGKLMALKPDVTLSIVKNTAGADTGLQKLYYNENVYRVSPGAKAFRELMQVGLECIGTIDDYCISEVVLLAAESLLTVSEESVLDISHLGLVTALLDWAGISREYTTQVFQLLGEKNFHELSACFAACGAPEEKSRLLLEVLGVSGALDAALPRLKGLQPALPELAALSQFFRILEILENTPAAKLLHVDFSVVDNVHYYNGIVFKGFVSGVPNRVLSGGQYDRLMKKMGRRCGALGFAVYTDALESLADTPQDYDVDILLCYSEDAPAKAVMENVQQLTQQGQTVMAAHRIPEGLRYRNLVKFEVSSLANNA